MTTLEWMKRILCAAAMVAMLSGPASGQEQDPPGLFNPDGSYAMHVACPLWQKGLNDDPERLLIRLQALSTRGQVLEWENEQLRERVAHLELVSMAIGKDLARLHNWSHCHWGQGECAALLEGPR